MDHTHSHHSHVNQSGFKSKQTNFSLAISATLHCLIGCGLGEILGMVIGTALDWSNMSTMILALTLGAIFGLLFGMIPLKRSGFTLGKALKMTIIAEGLSIVVMETVEVLVQVYTPGVMNAHLSDGIFWIGMFAGLAAGFVAALPVNYFMIKKGVGHRHPSGM